MNNHQQILQKIQTKESLLNTIKQWKQEGQKIVFTNGCFDLIHKYTGYNSANANIWENIDNVKIPN